MTHTARSSTFRKSSGNSFETKPNVTQNPLIIPHVVHVYVASSDEIESGSYVATIICGCGSMPDMVDMLRAGAPPTRLSRNHVGAELPPARGWSFRT
eukprot:COSAG02_NODE_9237_length_2281_cov_1.273144_2_plen_97_part_00